MEKSLQEYGTAQGAERRENREKGEETEKIDTRTCEIILQIMTAADFFTLECIYLFLALFGSTIYAFLRGSHTITRVHVLNTWALHAISKTTLPFPPELLTLASHRRKNANRC